MPKRYPGGVISATPLILGKDEYFENTVLLLNGDGTNGGQNNTFIDSSSNNFTITRNGNVTQGSFSPFGDRWSNYFDGVDDYLTAPSNAAFQFGTGDFTVEGFLTKSDMTNRGVFQISSTGLSTSSSNSIAFAYNGTEWVLYAKNTNTNAAASISLSRWYHWAVVRSSGTTKVYIDGTAVITVASDTTDYTGSSMAIGGYYSTAYLWNGNISNLRVVKGTAVYTTNFTPPTAPLTAITNTSLLTCQSNRFVDNSSNAFAITRNGDVRVTNFSPFAKATTYSAATDGASGYFDGAGDYVAIQNDNTFDTNATFTVEAWFYQNASDGNIFGRGGGAATWSGTDGHQFLLFAVSGTFYWMWNSGGTNTQLTTAAPAIGQWHHVAVGYNGTTTRVWLDGVSIGTSTTGYVMPSTRNIVRSGLSPSNETPFSGYIAGLRFVKGSDVYGVGNSTITVPSAPLTAITNTSLLLNFSNAAIADLTQTCDLETVGNAQISTSVKKYGTGSLAFDGTGDYIPCITDVRYWDFSTGPVTIEMWANFSTMSGLRPLVSVRQAGSGGWGLFWESNEVKFYCDTTSAVTIATTSSGVSSTGTWYHIAFVRNGTSWKIYVDGVEKGSGTSSNAINNQGNDVLTLGKPWPSGMSDFHGYIDDLRITRGIARYVSNFAPPPVPLPTNTSASSGTGVWNLSSKATQV